MRPLWRKSLHKSPHKPWPSALNGPEAPAQRSERTGTDAEGPRANLFGPALFGKSTQALLRILAGGNGGEVIDSAGDAASVIRADWAQQGGAAAAHRDRRLRGELARQFERIGFERAVRHETIDDAEPRRFRCVERAPGKEQLEGAVAADNARQVDKMDRRKHAEIDLRITELGAFAGEHDIARDRHRHAAAPRGAADRRNPRLAELSLRVVQADIEFVNQCADLVRRFPDETADIEPGAATLWQPACE